MSGKPGMKEGDGAKKADEEPKRFLEEVVLTEKQILRNRLLKDRDNMKEVSERVNETKLGHLRRVLQYVSCSPGCACKL